MKKSILFISICVVAVSCKPKTNDCIAAGMYFREQDSIKACNADSLMRYETAYYFDAEVYTDSIQAYSDSVTLFNYAKNGR